jgi:endonuclease/exonuclease/phosphatase family metal-dependent hydrolase
VLDDSFDDWQNSVSIFSDSGEDALPGNINFTDIRISDDKDRLYIYFNTNKELNIQSDNNLTLYLDIDSDSNTGIRTGGIGADLIYEFGRRRGTFFAGPFQYSLSHRQIGLVTSPTVTSQEFELCLSRTFQFGNVGYNLNSRIRMVLADNFPNGDRAPDNDGYYEYIMRSFQDSVVRNVSISREDNETVRVLSYNVLRDNFHDASLFDVYSRILKAIQPDIIGFSEIYNHSSGQSASVVERILPSPPGQTWYHSGAGPDIHLVSRYPVLRSQAIDGNGAFLLDMGAGKTLLIIVTHLPCCENDEGRQRESDNIMAFLRNVRFGISPFNVSQGTPIIIMGDKNFVGDSRQLRTLLTGDIADNTRYGIDFRPDWDNTDLADAKPATTGLPMTFTWPGTQSSFGPGRLDYIIYSDSELSLKKSFSLWTQGLTDNELSQYNLRRDDVNIASDHLPIVGDFSLGRQVSVLSDENKDTFPFHVKREGQQWVIFTKNKGFVRITDITGKTWLEQLNSNESNEISFFPPVHGIYIVQYYVNERMYSLKIWP